MSTATLGRSPEEDRFADRPMGAEERKVILASSLGTVFEWYDFYLFGSLAAFIGAQFFAPLNPTAQFIMTLLGFAAGFAVRPFGAVVFGRVGDMVGRKYTFLITILIMGISTLAVGLLPSYAQWGIWAPVILITLRLAQGLALGGEYGGAATYVAEHCPDGQRGYWTSWIQTTATLGLFVSLGVILVCRRTLSPEEFSAWGWRIPFWVSLFLVAFTYYIRRKMHESPLFQRMKASGKSSKNPLKESFGNWTNLRRVLLALYGATAGQGVVWYTGQFYAMNFIKGTIGVEAFQAEEIISVALVLGTPFFIVFGALSDKIGRKGIMLTGCLLALVGYYPIYQAKLSVKSQYDGEATKLVSPATTAAPTVKTIPADAAKNVKETTVTTTITTETYKDKTVRTIKKEETQIAGDEKPTVKETKTLKFESFTAPTAMWLTFLVWVQVIFVTMVYGPIAAFLVELFPTKIRYTSMSLPYHIGNGVFGGMVPFIGQLLIEGTKQPLAGLWYPMGVCAVTLVVGTLLVRERRNVRMHDEH